MPEQLKSSWLLATLLQSATLLLCGTALSAPYEHDTYLKASNAATGDNFGGSVATDGDLIVVGAPIESTDAAGINGTIGDSRIGASGAAYVFVRKGNGWFQLAHLKSPSPTRSSHFGNSVSVSADRIIIGQPGSAGGKVFVYRRIADLIEYEATITGSNTEFGDGFGESASISGNNILVGAPGEDGGLPGINVSGSNNSKLDSGAAYVFSHNGVNWEQEAYLKASNPDASDQFGESVSISGNSALVGAPTEDSAAVGIGGTQSDNSKSDSGAAYVFSKSGASWMQDAYLKASNPDKSDRFGIGVSMDGSNLVVVAYGEDSSAQGVHGDQQNNSARDAGGAYVMSKGATGWQQTAYLKPFFTISTSLTLNNNIYFSKSVSIRGDTIAIGGRNNSCFVFSRNSDSWMPLCNPTAPPVARSNSFGDPVAVGENLLLAGDQADNSSSNFINGSLSDTGASVSGAAYVFTPPALSATATRDLPSTLTSNGKNQLSQNLFVLSWQPVLGKRYDLKRSETLTDWTSFPGYPAASTGTQEIIGTKPKEFFRVIDMDATPPDSIAAIYPAPEDFAVPRFADFRIEFKEAGKINPSSVSLKIGNGAPITLTNSPALTFQNGTLRYDVIDAALGALGSEVSAELTVTDSDGFTTTYRWNFQLEQQAIVTEDLFIFGSATAQRTGQRFNASQRAVANSTVGAVRLPANTGDTWQIQAITENSIVISYAVAAPNQFHADMYVANQAPGTSAEVFYRKIRTVSDNPSHKTLTLGTTDVPLTEMVQQGSMSFSDNSVVFDASNTGTLTPMRSEPGYTWRLDKHVEDKSGNHIGAEAGVSLSMEEFRYELTPYVNFRFDIDFDGLHMVSATAGLDVDVAFVPRLDFYISLETDGSKTIVPQRTLRTIYLGAIAAVPVWLNVDFSMKARWGGQATAEGYLFAGFRSHVGAKANVFYNSAVNTGGPTSQLMTSTDEAFIPVGPTVVTEVSTSNYVEIEPRLDFLLEGLVGVYASITPSLKLSTSLSKENGVVKGRQFNGEAKATMNLGLSLNYTTVDDSWPKWSETFFDKPWCREWYPVTGWLPCVAPPPPPFVPPGTGGDTSR